MTSWQDQQGRGGRSGAALDMTRPQEEQPTSRRAARERERRAAEGLAPQQAHPSGVVDFRSGDLRSEYGSDQQINVPDTNDIWAAISRRGEQPAPARPEAADLAQFSAGVPQGGESGPQAPGGSAVSGELLDRVRGAVLRPRDTEPEAPAVPPTVAVQRPTALDPRSLTRREVRALQEDPQPAAWPMPEARTVAPQQQPAAFDPSYAEPTYDDYDDEYYDEEYTPDPTIAIRSVADQGFAPRPATAPVDLPSAFSRPAGDDELRFSSPAPHQNGQPRSVHPFAEADAPFVEPRARQAWTEQPWDDRTPSQQSWVEDAWSDEQPAVHPATPVRPVADFVAPEQPAQFQSGPPSEVTDLAGFEALIRQARSKAPEAGPATPAPHAAPAPQSKPLAWADDEDASEGFTGLLSRQIQGSHGSSNALILPEDAPVDLTQAVSPSGDPFITGSLNLSRSLSTTGASDTHYEPTDIDRLYDASQDEPAAGVAPVRASRAIAGAAAERAFTGPRRTRGSVLPTVLAIVAGAMAVGVVTLLVGSWVLKLF